MKIFISHSDKDQAIYLLLCAALDAASIDRWDVSSMSAGDSLSERLRNAITDCQICVFIATRRAIKSKWCLAELGAFWGAKKTVILFIADADVNESKLPPQFKGSIQARSPDELLKAIRSSPKVNLLSNSFCKEITTRKDLYDECRNLIETSSVIRDTTWGQRAPKLSHDEAQARELYRASVSIFLGENKSYYELLTAEGRTDFLDESLTKNEQFPNYQCKVLNIDISKLSIMDLMIADKNRVLFAHVSARHPARDVQYVLIESELVAKLFIQFYSEAWIASKSLKEYCNENSFERNITGSNQPIDINKDDSQK